MGRERWSDEGILLIITTQLAIVICSPANELDTFIVDPVYTGTHNIPRRAVGPASVHPHTYTHAHTHNST